MRTSCLTPFTKLNDKKNETMSLPCGKCPQCLKRRACAWSFRLIQQDKVSMTSQFITLTYDTEHVPISRNGYMCLNKRDVQLFLKRLRKAQTANDPTNCIKYYAVGEYGGQKWRPHYHLIMFNADITLLQQAWGLGSIYYGTVNGASVGYCLKYMTKPAKIPMHRNDDRIREFSLMSKGLGESYMTNAMLRWHHADLRNRMYLNIEDGKKIAMPRYYKIKIFTELERKQIAFFANKKRIEDELKAIRLGKTITERDRAERVKASFEKMHHNSTIGRNKF